MGQIKCRVTPAKDEPAPGKHKHSKAQQSNDRFKSPATEQKGEFLDAKDLKPKLDARIGDLAFDLKGKPNAKFTKGSELRYGNKGAFAVYTKEGRWYDYDSGSGGDALSLIDHELDDAKDFKDVVRYGAKFLGMGPQTWNVQLKKPKPTPKIQKDDKPKRLAWVHRVVEGSKPITGTLAEQYLKGRHINKVSGRDLKFNPKVWVGKDEATGKNIYAPALVAIARDKQGSVAGLQMIYLDKDSARKLDTDIQKRSLGSISGNAVTLSGNKSSGLSFVSEGPETGLSVQEAIKGAHVVATLGKSNFKKLDPDALAQQVVLLADKDDPTKGIKDDKLLLDAAARLKEAGKDVHIVMPEWLDGKTDMNDVLVKKGVDALRHTLSNSVSVQSDASELQQHNDAAMLKRFINDADNPGSERDSLQRYDEALRQQYKQSARGLEPEQAKVSRVDPSVDQLNRQAQIDREV